MRTSKIRKKLFSIALTVTVVGTGWGGSVLADSIVTVNEKEVQHEQNKVCVVKELTDERTVNSNTYLLSDGSRKVEIFTEKKEEGLELYYPEQ